MIFNGRTIDEISDVELDALVQEHASERQHLEFKGTYDIKEPKDKLEVLRDITSLANGGGGYLIIGIQDDGTGKPCAYRPQAKEELERMKKSIQQLCLDHITERIPKLEFRVREPNNHPILVVFIPDSIETPHMVKFDRRTDFYTRYDEGKREMSIAEIRRAFQEDTMQIAIHSISHKMDEVLRLLLGEKIVEKISVSGDKTSKVTSIPSQETTEVMRTTPFFPSAFLDGDQLTRASYDITKVKVGNKPYFWIAVTPVLLKGDALDVDSDELRSLLMAPPGSRSGGWNMEGTTEIKNVPDGIEKGSEDHEHLLLYKNAHMEFKTPLDEHFCWRQKPEEFLKRPELYPYPVVEYPVTFLRLYAAVLHLSKIQDQFIINLRYINLKGYRLRPYGPKQMGYMFAEELKPFSYKDLFLPEIKTDQSFNPDQTAFKLLEQVYNAFGLSAKEIPFWQADHFDFPSR